MKKTIAIMLGVLAMSISLFADDELDQGSKIANQNQRAVELPKTVILKKDANGNVYVLKSKDLLDKNEKNKTLLANSAFEKVSVVNNDKLNELDKDHSSASWYYVYYPTLLYSFFYGYYGYYNYAPIYNYYGYSYNYYPYYSYYYGNCWYWWYRW